MGKRTLLYQLLAFLPEIYRGNIQMFLECCCKVGRRIAVVYTDLGDTFILFYLEPPCASFQPNTLHKLVERFIGVLFEHTHQMVFGITAMLRNIVNCDFFFHMIKDKAYGFVDNSTPDCGTVFLFHFPSPAFQHFLMLRDQPC